jgi:signal transduction histidine kinase
VLGFAQDGDSPIWAATSSGLGRYKGDRWTKIGSESNFAGKTANAVFLDRDGALWVATEDALVVMRARAQVFEPTGIPIRYVAKIVQAANGRLWMAETSRSVRPVPLSGSALPANDTEVQVGSGDIMFDRFGALWITSLGDGLRRVTVPERSAGRIAQFSTAIEQFTIADGLTDNYNRAILQDREGNIWIGTNGGLDQFREGRIVPVALPINPSQSAMAPGDDGDVWVTNVGWMFHLRGVSTTKMRGGVSGDSTYRDRHGTLWWTEAAGIARLDHGRLSVLPFPKGSFVPGYVSGAVRLTADRHDVLWVAIERHGVLRLEGDRWTRFDLPPDVAELAPTAAFTDGNDRIWFGYRGGTIIAIDGTKVQRLTSSTDGVVRDVSAINGRNGNVWVVGESGLMLIDGERLRPLRPVDAPAFGKIMGVQETSDGSLWLSEIRGVVHIAPPDVQRYVRDPDYRVPFELFTSVDGLPGTFRGTGLIGAAMQGTDGRLWLMATQGLAWLDPLRPAVNALAPPVVIRSITAGGSVYAAESSPRLPAGTRDVRLDYTALSLSIPGRVRFRYRLDGSDTEWQDAGTRREAFYTNLRPREYRFRVLASNNDGVWNETGAVVAFSIAPAWYQTRWFMLLCVCSGLAVVAAAHRLRLRQLSRAMAVRFDERLAERTRVARDLHDTFLQTVQGSKLVADHALKNQNDHARLVGAMTQLSEWLERATGEGRAALNSLRASTTEINDLSEAFRRAIEECRVAGGPDVGFSVTGAAKQMHPIVRDEVYRIGYEAIRNACVHSGATRIDVTLEYDHDLTVRVSDNGVGINAAIAEKGKDSHFGLRGMRERAERINAKLTLVSSVGTGTTITLTVPGQVAFRSA